MAEPPKKHSVKEKIVPNKKKGFRKIHFFLSGIIFSSTEPFFGGSAIGENAEPFSDKKGSVKHLFFQIGAKINSQLLRNIG
jgi:hypothetical protein